MDGQNLEFADGTFDVVISRNLTWNLENPQKAYSEWQRVLKEGGVLLNFDANWYGYLYDAEKKDSTSRIEKTWRRSIWKIIICVRILTGWKKSHFRCLCRG